MQYLQKLTRLDLSRQAHAMTPHQGVGGGQAIEVSISFCPSNLPHDNLKPSKDAHILARLLAHPSSTKHTIPSILKLHERLRLTRTQAAAEKSRTNGMMYEFNHPDFLFNDPASHPEGPSRAELEALGNGVGTSFAWLAEGGIEEDWAEAQAQLKVISEE